MTIQLDLAPESETWLREQARREGYSVPEFLRRLVQQRQAMTDTNAPIVKAVQDDAIGTDVADVIARYERQELTHGEVAAVLGMSRVEALQYLSAHGASPFQSSVEEILQEAGVEFNN